MSRQASQLRVNPLTAQSHFFVSAQRIDMYLCYIDESGNSELSGNTTLFVLAGILLPIWHWRSVDREIRNIKRKYDLFPAWLSVRMPY